MSDESRCRSCGKPVVFATMPSGKKAPIERDPVPDGNVVLERDLLGDVHARVLKKGETVAAATPRYRNHFIGCPERELWRKRA
jgi:hypothetical protein